MAGDQIEALVRANANLVRRIAALEQRVAQLERAASGAAPEAPILPEPAPPPPAPAPYPAEPVATPAARLETRIGLAWINRIAVVTCILAAAFLFKYAADSDWIGPAARVLTGIALGLAALVSSELLFRRGHAVYAQGIAALSAGILYLSCYAAFDFYHLIGATLAFAALTLVTALSSVMALRFRAVAIAILGLLGAYATPLLLSSGEKRYAFLLTYLFVLSAAALFLARRQNWRSLEYVAAVGSGSLYLGLLDSSFPAEALLPLRLYAAAYYALFATSRHWAVFFIAHLLAAASLSDLFRQHPQTYFACLTALGAIALALSFRRAWTYGPAAALTAFILAWGIWSGPAATPTATALLYTANYALLAAWIPLRLLVTQSQIRQIDFLVAATAAILYYTGLYSSLEQIGRNTIAAATYALAAAHGALAWFLHRSQPATPVQHAPVQFFAVVAAVLVTLAIPLQLAGFRASMAWSLEAAAVAWLSARYASTLLRLASLLIFGLALAQLYFSEAPKSPLLPFTVTAAAMGLSARWLIPRQLQAIVYGGAHAVMLTGLVLEALAWARRQPPDLVSNLETFSVTAVLALYGFVLVAIAVVLRHGLTRWLGLACIALVVAKLYLYDVWTLRLLYRVIAFGTLGILLLATSFLYSKYRGSLEKWIQQNDSSL